MNLFVALLIALGVLAGAALWVAAAMYVFVDAQKRNVPHATLWAVGTFLVGPVGLIAYLVDRPRARKAPCGFCGEMILETDERCPFCGRAPVDADTPNG